MVPVQSAQGESSCCGAERRRFRPGGSFQLLKAKAVLEPEHAVMVSCRAISRAEVLARRYFRRAPRRMAALYVWLALSSCPGTGCGWSGLRFDLVQLMGRLRLPERRAICDICRRELQNRHHAPDAPGPRS
jgi:hypothetical protein